MECREPFDVHVEFLAVLIVVQALLQAVRRVAVSLLPQWCLVPGDVCSDRKPLFENYLLLGMETLLSRWIRGFRLMQFLLGSENDHLKHA